MRATSVVALEFSEEALIADVEPSWQIPRCSGCGKKRRSVYDSRARTWRHLDLGGVKTLLRYRTRRVSCKKRGVVVETVPWAESCSRFTLPMERHVAYHAQRTDKTTVSTLMRVAWRTVGQIIKRYVRRERNETGDPPENLRTIDVGVEHIRVVDVHGDEVVESVLERREFVLAPFVAPRENTYPLETYTFEPATRDVLVSGLGHVVDADRVPLSEQERPDGVVKLLCFSRCADT